MLRKRAEVPLWATEKYVLGKYRLRYTFTGCLASIFAIHRHATSLLFVSISN